MEFHVKNTGERRAARVKVSYKSYAMPVPPEHIGGDMFQERHRLEMLVSTDFWSNSAQMPRKKEQAKKLARAHLFKDMIPLVEEIMLDSDNDDVFRLAGDLKNLMIEGESQ